MSIENELFDWLHSNLRELGTKARDIELIDYYYGLREDVWPTYDETKRRFNLGSRQRVEQILDSKFKSKVNAGDLPSAIECAKQIVSKQIIRLDRIAESLQERGLVQSEVNMRGLLNLLHDLNLCIQYEIYTPELDKTTWGTYFSSHNLFVIDEAILPKLRKALKIAKTLPGSHGIARLSFLKAELGEECGYFDELVELVKSDDDSWFSEMNGETFYLLETRDNALINSMGKIKCVANMVDLNELTSTLSNSLRKRTPKYQYPSDELLSSYLVKSKHTTPIGTAIELNLGCGGLTQIEDDVVKVLSRTPSSEFTTIASELGKKGYGRDWIEKSIASSPVIHVDKSGGRRHYTYSLVGRGSLPIDNQSDHGKYGRYRQRLIKSGKDGTDREQSGLTRKEHPILREWLFDGKLVEKCAVCGEEYSVVSLVTAHKKKRADCSGNERTDPYIVMPLCLFGCDHLYERGYLYVQNGKVSKGLAEDVTAKEESIIRELAGKALDEKWLKGDESYFRKPKVTAAD